MIGPGHRWVKRAVALATVLASIALAVPAAANAAGVRGAIRDATCYGPCMIDGPPPPIYGGTDAKVTVLTRGGVAPLITRYPNDGRFHLRLDPGRYVVRVRVTGAAADLWSSDAERFRVRRGETARVTLVIANQAVL